MSPSQEPCLRNANYLVWQCLYVRFYLVLFHYDHSSLYSLNFAFCIHRTALSCLGHESVPLWCRLCDVSFFPWSCSLLSILWICLSSPAQSFLYWLYGLKSHSRVTCENSRNFLVWGRSLWVMVCFSLCLLTLPSFSPSLFPCFPVFVWYGALSFGSCRACTHLIVIEGG